MNQTPYKYDAILVMSFGGPEGPEDVMPFLDNVLRGKNVPDERKQEVAHHYLDFGGKSPLNAQNRELVTSLQRELKDHGIDLPVYWGNRNWHPMIADTLRQMRDAGVKTFLTFTTSAFSCYSGCRQYREDIMKAQELLGDDAPAFDKIRTFFNHPDFIEVNRIRLEEALAGIPEDRRPHVHVAFTAHSIPMAKADKSPYVDQLTEACRLTAEAASIERWKLVYQSRSGPPHQPWLEPDICDHIETLQHEGVRELMIHPIGFISDHMEVIYDLDTEARELCNRIGMTMVRAKTAGSHPIFIRMVRDLIEERLFDRPDRRTVGRLPAKHDVCPENCCLSGRGQDMIVESGSCWNAFAFPVSPQSP